MKDSIEQKLEFKASPKQVFNALTENAEFRTWTGGKDASIDNSTGGRISLFDGMITGLTVESIKDQRLIQVWRAGNWPEGVYSLITGDDSITHLSFEQTGHPSAETDHLSEGWKKMYWDPLAQYLSASK